MKAATIQKQGAPVAPNVTLVTDWPDPSAGPGEALVRSEASALNHLDLFVGMGLPGLDLEYPRISGSDAAGKIEAVGPGVDESWIGRRVLLRANIPNPDRPLPGQPTTTPDRTMIGEHTNGALAELFTAPITNLLDIGDTDPVEAAAFGLTHLTAWRMLISRAQMKAGQIILIPGIGGGVALALLNIARHFGCTTIVTSRHQWKLDKAAELGADHAILDEGEDWSKQVRAVTGKRGVDVCADSVGKAIHMSCIKSLTRGGVFVTCGCTSGPDATTDLARIFWNQLSILGSTMGDHDEFRQAVALLRAGHIRPVIDKVYDPADASDAFARLEAADQFGKIVIRWR